MTTAVRRAARVALFACALGGAASQISPSSAIAASFHTGFGTLPSVSAVTAPGPVLSEADADLYRRIFALQDAGRFSEATALTASLGNPVLMGHVVAQRVLHPSYRAGFAEAQEWLANNADHPQASKIHAMARKKGKGPLASPTWAGFTGAGGHGGDALGSGSAESGAGWGNFRRALSQNQYQAAERMTSTPSVPLVERGRMKGLMAYAYFIDGEDTLARQTAEQAVASVGNQAPTARWAAGLAAWRQGDVEGAGAHFRALAQSPEASPWLASAGAYWAARAALRTREPAQVSRWLKQAADQPRTFYGLLARRQLGLPLPFQWAGDSLPPAQEAALKATAAGQRALALVQIGRMDDAEQELRGLVPRADDTLRSAVLALADSGGMSSLAFGLVSHVSRNRAAAAAFDASFNDDDEEVAQAVLGARYPVPAWTPSGGWQVDRALVYAFMRQESGFNPDARSPVGARGLMQVMPATARFVAHRLGDGTINPRFATQDAMATPEMNMAVGQKYLQHLMSQPEIDGNLFFLAVAYNAGPGNLNKWLGRTRHGDDPLLFIESIPSRETRVFVERVVANLWIYRNRLGQDNTSLDMVAAGRWPRYSQQDSGLDDMTISRRAF